MSYDNININRKMREFRELVDDILSSVSLPKITATEMLNEIYIKLEEVITLRRR